MPARIVLEVCAFSVQSCRIAEKAGAARVELCANPVEGGTTPSHGAIRQARKATRIELYPIIRPRAGDYCYDADDFAVMLHDIAVCKALGCDGISVGIQKPGGRLDTRRLKRIVEQARPMGVTCNRVFDTTPDPFEALEELIACGCERVLTSGQAVGAPEAIPLLARLVRQAGRRIIVMPGAGIRASNIARLVRGTQAREYHASARVAVPGRLTRPNPRVLDIGRIYEASAKELRNILSRGRRAAAGITAACRRPGGATGSRTDPAGAA